ncbi:MAG: hypothetical protein BHW64_04570 [Candidatus Melainabacteria bacterium LEY3_CP_29_8]|nr:MAG: hypothetical protein BHW64_04570 [Candidatus Melainabacteria bacterium LEY3_CP_29_8]
MEAILNILTTEDMTELRQGIKNLILNAVESDLNMRDEYIVSPNFVIDIVDDVGNEKKPIDHPEYRQWLLDEGRLS